MSRVRTCVFWLALLASLAGAAGRAVDSTRLTETTIDYASLLRGGLPNDPFGKHGPKHVAGYYKLNRSEVWCFHGHASAPRRHAMAWMPVRSASVHLEALLRRPWSAGHRLRRCGLHAPQALVLPSCVPGCLVFDRLCADSSLAAQDAEMFYFFFESRNDPANDPVVLWMTGACPCKTQRHCAGAELCVRQSRAAGECFQSSAACLSCISSDA